MLWLQAGARVRRPCAPPVAHRWRGLEAHELQRGSQYATVVKLRSDLQHLPVPLPLLDRYARAELFMRGDWLFWGGRQAMRAACDYSMSRVACDYGARARRARVRAARPRSWTSWAS